MKAARIPRQDEEAWEKPHPLDGELPKVEQIAEELLPVSFRPLVCDVAERMQTPVDYPAVVAVLCLAGAVNRRALIQPKAHDTSWVVVPNLWGGIIAPPGYMKSPVIAATTRPLVKIEAEWQRDYQESHKGFAREIEEYELRRSAWKEQFKSSAKYGKAAPQRPEDPPEEPTALRLIINDATFESMHQKMSENPAGIFVIRDELTGWWSALERAGREGERAFCLQAWNGDTGHTIDRIGRGTIHVPACCMSMLGGIQPGRLKSYLADALEDGPGNDGLIQRFQLMVWPDTPEEWKYVDRKTNAAWEESAAAVFRSLVRLDSENPLRFGFDPDAQQLFVEWLAELETKVRGGEMHPALVSHLAKYRKLMPALALLFELADRAAPGSGGFEGFVGSYSGENQNLKVSMEHARQAAAWCGYLESHARRVYSCVATAQMRAAGELADKIRRKKVGASGSFSCREVYVNGWSGLDSPEAVRSAAEVLQDAHWIREQDGGSGPRGGVPQTAIQLTPL